MIELSFEYWNQLAAHTINICSLLAGFSIAVIISLLVYEKNSKIITAILMLATVAASCFLSTLFAMTQILMKTTPGFPFPVEDKVFFWPRALGMFSYVIGIIALLLVIALSGWTKSKQIGMFTSVVSFIAFVFIAIMLVS